MVKDATFKFNKIYRPVFTTKARYIDIWGGRAAGRSHFGTSYFLFLITQPQYFRGCFLRNVFSDIRDSLFQDFKDRIEESDFEDKDFDINESKMSILYKPTGNTIISKGFKKSSGNRSAKLKSLAGITHVLVEEADENGEREVNKLDDSIRTNKIDNIQILFLHNPPGKNHWLCKRFYNLLDVELYDSTGKRIEGYYKAIPKSNPDVLVIFSTYKDNVKNLNEKSIKKYEAYGDESSPFFDEEQYYVDVCGLVPEGARGRIYRNWKPITTSFYNSLPYEEYIGLDFGFSDDETAIVRVKSHNNRNFFKEALYEKHLTNTMIGQRLKSLGIGKRTRIFADSSEPKSIQELKDLGFNVIPAEKGPDSVLFGIKQLSGMENYYTEDSKNLIKENEEYKWHLDQEGNPTQEPVDKNNHIKDAARYAVTTNKGLNKKRKIIISNPEPAAETQENKLNWIN